MKVFSVAVDKTDASKRALDCNEYFSFYLNFSYN